MYKLVRWGIGGPSVRRKRGSMHNQSDRRASMYSTHRLDDLLEYKPHGFVRVRRDDGLGPLRQRLEGLAAEGAVQVQEAFDRDLSGGVDGGDGDCGQGKGPWGPPHIPPAYSTQQTLGCRLPTARPTGDGGKGGAMLVCVVGVWGMCVECAVGTQRKAGFWFWRA